jgi:hypothetical protein
MLPTARSMHRGSIDVAIAAAAPISRSCWTGTPGLRVRKAEANNRSTLLAATESAVNKLNFGRTGVTRVAKREQDEAQYSQLGDHHLVGGRKPDGPRNVVSIGCFVSCSWFVRVIPKH